MSLVRNALWSFGLLVVVATGYSLLMSGQETNVEIQPHEPAAMMSINGIRLNLSRLEVENRLGLPYNAGNNWFLYSLKLKQLGAAPMRKSLPPNLTQPEGDGGYYGCDALDPGTTIISYENDQVISVRGDALERNGRPILSSGFSPEEMSSSLGSASLPLQETNQFLMVADYFRLKLTVVLTRRPGERFSIRSFHLHRKITTSEDCRG
jgi:hypothetical protein